MGSFDEELRFAGEVADAADAISTSLFRSASLEVRQKDDLTPVTDAYLAGLTDPDVGPVELPTASSDPDIGKADVSNAMHSFANPAVSGDVKIELEDQQIVLKPALDGLTVEVAPEQI